MASTGLELLGMTLAVLGWLGTLVSFDSITLMEQ